MPYGHSIADGQRTDPLTGFHYKLDIAGKLTGFFTEVSGVGSETEVIEHKAVNEKGVELIHKIPGRLKFEDITLKRGITDSLDIWKWRKQVEDGDIKGARQDGSIVMFDQSLKEVARWDFFKAWPSKVSGPSFNAGSTEIGVEELVIVHEHMERVK